MFVKGKDDVLLEEKNFLFFPGNKEFIKSFLCPTCFCSNLKKILTLAFL